MSKKRIYLWTSVSLLFFVLLFCVLISTLYQSTISTSGEQNEMEKKISQNAQQELSNLVFEKDEISAALSKEQAKVAELEAQLTEITQKYNSLEQESFVQSTLLDAHRLCDYGNYKESQLKLQSIATTPLSESGIQVYNNIGKALTKKRYPIKLR